jgi:hypothetical protein
MALLICFFPFGLDSFLEVIKDGIKKMLWQRDLPFIFEAAAIDEVNICDCLTIIDYGRIKDGFEQHIPTGQKISRTDMGLFPAYFSRQL